MNSSEFNYISRSIQDTNRLADRLISSFPRPLILALTGELGSGKTAFVQGLAAKLGISDRVQSPTFTLMHEYTTYDGLLVHADLYRLEKKEEINDLGIMYYFNNPKTVVAVEWADRAPYLFPLPTVWLHFELARNHRIIQVKTKDQPIHHYLSMGFKK
jgi:tRNA threonylcarbamoyladenosine biosynthesis protein TsaE